ncbi:MAG: transporter substrate-binding domain-containing protein [Clostridiales bacterium]|nr:transporter substrate-binding domain-containing protein [Clostridiales bacterium]
MKKWIALLAAAVLLLGLTACKKQEVESDRIAKIKEAGVLVVGTSADYPPYEFHIDENGEDKIVGFDMALSRRFAEELGVELKIVDMPFDGLLISLDEGMFDFVMAGLTPRADRAEFVDFTDIFFVNKQVTIIRKADADKYKTTADFKGVPIGVQRNTVQEEIAADLTGEENVIKLVKFPDLIIELSNGKIEAICCNIMTAASYVSGNDDLMVNDCGIVYENTGFAGAVKKGDAELLAFLNEMIVKVKEDGSLDRYVEEAAAQSGAAKLLEDEEEETGEGEAEGAEGEAELETVSG